MTVRIAFNDLAVPESDERRPLGYLTEDDHIHGDLLIEIQGRRLPHLGFFGEDDVCFGEWLEQLAGIRAALTAPAPSRHVFDEGEQGQPAFVFEREGDQALVTIANAKFSGGVADPDWQRVAFSPADFVAEVDRFRRTLLAHIRAVAPRTADQWARAHGLLQ